MGDSLIRSVARALFVPPRGGEDRLNLRVWFAGFVGWLGVLAVAARYGLVNYETGDPLGMAIWLLALYLFYLSLCCTFFPAPTMWIVMMLASDYVAGEIGVIDYPISRLIAVASIGAWGTSMANLNEYHIFTFLLRHGRMSRIRDTRLYRVAARWFGVRPFWTIVLFSFVPIPVDIIRWLAITYRYPRAPFFLAYYLGRWVRYAGLAAVTIWGELSWIDILIIQGVVAVIALVKILREVIRQHRAGETPADAEACVEVGPPTECGTMAAPSTSATP